MARFKASRNPPGCQWTCGQPILARPPDRAYSPGRSGSRIGSKLRVNDKRPLAVLFIVLARVSARWVTQLLVWSPVNWAITAGLARRAAWGDHR
jgi:hypothetical protein